MKNTIFYKRFNYLFLFVIFLFFMGIIWLCLEGGKFTVTHTVNIQKLQLGESYKTKGECEVAIKEIDTHENKCLIEIKVLSTDEILSGWVTEGKSVSFAKKWFVTSGLFVKDIQENIVELWIHFAK